MAPTGPIALVVLRYGMRGQKLSAILVAFGGALAEAGYALLAYLGITLALSHYPLESFLLRLISALILMCFAAIWILKGHSPPHERDRSKYAGASFLLGLSIAGLNPTFLLTWAGVVAIARGTGLISDIEAAPGFALGVISGPVLWFYILLRLLQRHSKSISPEKLHKIERSIPYILFILAAIVLVRAFLPFMK